VARYPGSATRLEDIGPVREYSLNPSRALLLGFPLALFLGALLSDIAYYRSYEIQWANFAAWLIAGALVFAAVVLLIALIDFFRQREGRARPTILMVLVGAMWILGFINALIHARDGWASMPTGLVLSVIVALLALAAAWVGLTGTRRVEAN